MFTSVPVCLDIPDDLVLRYRYALDELLRGLGLEAAPARHGDARIVVSEEAPSGSALWVQVQPEQILATNPVEVATLGWVEHGGERWPLPVGDDVLASVFWWLAGVQEAATVERDRHGRFPYASSLQHELAETEGPSAPGTAMRPAVDAYREWLGEALRQLGVEIPGRTWGGAPWALALSHDVDALDAGRLRGLIGDTVRGTPGRALRRAFGPNQRRASLEALLDLARRQDVRSTVFFKAGGRAPEDIPYSLDGRTSAWLHQIVAEGFEVGLHPSYSAADHPRQLAAERARLATSAGTELATVRTHFLRWIDPVTPRLIEHEGFQIDSSLGFSETPGFRRGTAHPFRLYDLHADRVTDLWEMPLAVMDTTLFDHQRLSDTDALASAIEVCETARRAGGVSVVLWHSLVGDAETWTRRLPLLDQVLDHAKENGAHIGSLGSCLAGYRGQVSNIP